MTDDIRQGFIRQRRNLMGISLILGFYLQAGLSMDKLSVFGNEISLADPAVAERALWIAWVYFLARYLQHVHDLGDRGFVTTYQQRMHELVRKTAIDRYRRDWADHPDVHDRGSLLIVNDSVDVLESRRDFWRVHVRGSVAYNRADGSTISTGGDRNVPVAGWELWRLRIQSVFHVVVKTRLATEFALPLIVGTFPVAEKLMG